MKAKRLSPKATGRAIPHYADKPLRESAEHGQKPPTSDTPIRQKKQLAGTSL